MLINLWSTPRTGSVWYSYHLAAQHRNSLVLTEMFHVHHMDMYHLRNADGSIQNFHHYIPNGFYVEFFIDDTGNIKKRSITGERTRTVKQEEEYCFDLIKQFNGSQVLILHNHVEPINPSIMQYCIDKADKNIWIYRKDKVQQLASYAVALGTKKFASFRKQVHTNEVAPDCEIELLERLVKRIKLWDSLTADKRDNDEIICFEDIKFYDRIGFPYDQNLNPLEKLSDNIKQVILQLVSDYEDSRNQ